MDRPAMIQILVILGLVVGAGIAGGSGIWYLQHEAIDKCNAQWKQEISDANLKLERLSSAKEAELREAEDKAELDRKDAEGKLAEKEQELELARTATPLSKPCDECRIPRERIWGGVRRKSDGRSTGGRHKTPAIVRHKQTVTPPTPDPGLPRPPAGSLHSTGAGESPVVRDPTAGKN
jgi:hypothetical protein